MKISELLTGDVEFKRTESMTDEQWVYAADADLLPVWIALDASYNSFDLGRERKDVLNESYPLLLDDRGLDVIPSLISLIEGVLDEVGRYVLEAYEEYVKNIGKDEALERFLDSLYFDDSPDEREVASGIYKKEGILPFVRVSALVFSSEKNLFALCVDCPTDDYLDEHGFVVVISGEKVEWVIYDQFYELLSS